MTYDETLKILSVLKAAYPQSFKGLTKRDAEAIVSLWQMQFAGDAYEALNAAVIALIATRTAGYSPTVGEVKEQIQRLSQRDEIPESTAWAMVTKACRNGLYGAENEFEKLPPEVQRAVGSPEQIREWAEMETEVLQSVVASNFMRNYRTQRTREKENAMLPPAIRELVGSLANGMRMLKE